MSEERWTRRGHKRKPNGFVLWLYSIFDWIQDFGPMFATVFKGLGKAGSTTWTVFARSIMLCINLALLIGIIYLSIGHSYTLLTHNGLSGVAAWVAVAVWEAVFVYCSVVIDSAYRNKRKSSKAAWVGFLMGFSFVSVSNYMGMADTYMGKAVGIAIPCLLLVMKKVLEHQFKNEPAGEENKSWFTSIKSKITTQLAEENLVLESKLTEENLIEIELENALIEAPEKLDLEPPKMEQKPLDIAPEKLHQNPVLDATKTDSVPEEKQVANLIENQDLKTEDKQSEINQQAKTSSGRKLRKTKGSTKGKKPKKITADQVDYDAIIEVAKRMIEDSPENKTPTKYKLAKEADTTEHHAQKAIDLMDEKLSVKPIENLKQNLDLESPQKPDLERPKLKLAK